MAVEDAGGPAAPCAVAGDDQRQREGALVAGEKTADVLCQCPEQQRSVRRRRPSLFVSLSTVSARDDIAPFERRLL